MKYCLSLDVKPKNFIKLARMGGKPSTPSKDSGTARKLGLEKWSGPEWAVKKVADDRPKLKLRLENP